MDNIDDANERAATYLQAQIDAVTKKSSLPAAHECDACGAAKKFQKHGAEPCQAFGSASTAKSWKN